MSTLCTRLPVPVSVDLRASRAGCVPVYETYPCCFAVWSVLAILKLSNGIVVINQTWGIGPAATISSVQWFR